MRACMCAPVQSHAGHQRGTTFTPSPCSALGHSWASLRPLEVSGAGTHQVCQDGDQAGGDSVTCQPPLPGKGTRWDQLVGASLGARAAPPQPCAPLGWLGATVWQGCLCPPASLGFCLSPAPWSPLRWIKH